MSERLKAAEQLESRALGRPKETVEHQDGQTQLDRDLDDLPTEDLEAIVQRGRELRLVQDGGIEH